MVVLHVVRNKILAKLRKVSVVGVGSSLFNFGENYEDNYGYGHSMPIDLNIVETTPELLQIIEKQDC